MLSPPKPKSSSLDSPLSKCKPFHEEGLGLKHMVAINKVAMLKLGWDFSSFDFVWAASMG